MAENKKRKEHQERRQEKEYLREWVVKESRDEKAENEAREPKRRSAYYKEEETRHRKP